MFVRILLRNLFFFLFDLYVDVGTGMSGIGEFAAAQTERSELTGVCQVVSTVGEDCLACSQYFALVGYRKNKQKLTIYYTKTRRPIPPSKPLVDVLAFLISSSASSF